jgi:hypothetical protein
MKNIAAIALGRLGGQTRSEAKAKAARANGKKGGWPKGKSRRLSSWTPPPLRHDCNRSAPAASMQRRVRARSRGVRI